MIQTNLSWILYRSSLASPTTRTRTPMGTVSYAVRELGSRTDGKQRSDHWRKGLSDLFSAWAFFHFIPRKSLCWLSAALEAEGFRILASQSFFTQTPRRMEMVRPAVALLFCGFIGSQLKQRRAEIQPVSQKKGGIASFSAFSLCLSKSGIRQQSRPLASWPWSRAGFAGGCELPAALPGNPKVLGLRVGGLMPLATA